MKPSHALAALLVLPLALGEGEVPITTSAGPFATFHHGEGDRVPFLWPVLGPGGVEVTRAYPMIEGRAGESSDHPHHTSLWFAHGDVNGSDFWHDRDGARIVPAGEVVVVEDDGAARVTSRHRWVTGEDVELLEEARTMTFRDLEGGRTIDLDLGLTALADVTFGDTKEGTFALRLHPALRPKGEVAAGTPTKAAPASSASLSLTAPTTCATPPGGTPGTTGSWAPIPSASTTSSASPRAPATTRSRRARPCACATGCSSTTAPARRPTSSGTGASGPG